MARIIICFSLLLQACTPHMIRCDTHLQPINAPADKATPAQKAADAGTTAP
jgi:hypothetical protein